MKSAESFLTPGQQEVDCVRSTYTALFHATEEFAQGTPGSEITAWMKNFIEKGRSLEILRKLDTSLKKRFSYNPSSVTILGSIRNILRKIYTHVNLTLLDVVAALSNIAIFAESIGITLPKPESIPVTNGN